MQYRKWIGPTALLASIAMGISSPYITAQEPPVKVIEAAARKCTCERWTCPICQQRKLKETCPPIKSFRSCLASRCRLCPGKLHPIKSRRPGHSYHAGQELAPIVPGQPSPDSFIPSPSDAPGGAEFRLNDGTPSPVPGTLPGGLDQANIGSGNAANQDSDIGGIGSVGRSSNTSGLFASNTGGLADPGLFGDFFGPTSNANSIISQTYVFDAVGVSNGSGIDYDLAGTPTPNDIVGGGPGGLTLLEPTIQDDLVRPTAPGWTYAQGTATQTGSNTYRLRYSFVRELTVPSSFAQQRMKLAENTSPIPQNRIFVNYSLFQNVPLAGGINVNRISPGFETLLMSPNTSFELRSPFATTLSSDILAEGGTNTGQVEFGNLFFSLKQVFWKRDKTVLSTGLSMTVPTADSTRIFSAGREIYRIDNESVHIMPFVGGFYKPSARTFMQGVMQVDIDANGNTVKSRSNYNDPNLTTIGRLQDLNLLYLDSNVGFWAYRNQGKGLTGIAPMLEGHFNRSLNPADCVVDGNGTRIQLPVQEFDNFNIVAATVFEFNNRSRFGIGYGAPIGNGTDRAFDGEFRATFNRYY